MLRHEVLKVATHASGVGVLLAAGDRRWFAHYDIATEKHFHFEVPADVERIQFTAKGDRLLVATKDRIRVIAFRERSP